MINKNFAIVFNENIEGSQKVKDELSSLLIKRGVSFKAFSIDNLKLGYDFVFVIGGDGTILKTARFYSKSDTVIFGINLGHLGFLSQSCRENINDSVNKIFKGEFEVQNRIMLSSGDYLALNDIVIKGTMTGRTSKFALQINDKFLCDYLADGIIISTPTGSTAYGLSAGGPIVYPALNSFVITPICPHTLTARSLVVPDSEVIKIFAGSAHSKYVASCDGQSFYEFDREIEIKKSDFCAKLAVLKGSNFYEILKNKLHWSMTPDYREQSI